VPGANVTLTDTQTRTTRTTTTNESGRYIFVNVTPGVYNVDFEAKGFSKGKVAGQKVTVGDVSSINIVLQVGTQNETVEVQATGTQLQTTTATVGTSMTFDMTQALPSLSRDVSGLALLQPATAPNLGSSGLSGSVAGSNADQNMFQLDGGNNSSDMDGTGTVYTAGFAANPITGTGSTIPSGVMPTPIESVEEFKVGVVGQGGDFNSAAGNQVSMVTKRGTDQWHGAAYEYYYGTNFSANNWSNGHAPSKDPATGALRSFTPLTKRHENRFGASAGGPILPWNFLGGKTYLFGFYQGVRYPNATLVEKPMPSDLLRAGVVQINTSGSTWTPYNLNAVPVTVNGVTYQPANCGSSTFAPCDPRKIGLNPIVNQIWSQWMPTANDPACSISSTNCDQHNTFGYKGTLPLPYKDNNWVFRLDHDFGQKNKFMGSYRYYKIIGNPDTSQLDVGGVLPGDTKGQFAAKRLYPQYPGILNFDWTSIVTTHLTNDLHYNYTYNWWAWDGPGSVTQPINGLGGAVEIGGESASALIPYNVNTQSTRTRFWDGQDHLFKDDVTLLHGNHLFQFGGAYQRNFNWHDRNDNGQGIDAANVYQVADNTGINWAGFYPQGLPSGQQTAYQGWAAQVLGLVGQPQTLYTRVGQDLHLLPLGTHAQDKSVIPFYNFYFSDTWHMKPNFTLTYGMSYALELPPFEQAGKQVMLTDSAGNAVYFNSYQKARQQAALNGQVYDPVLGFATVGNLAGGRKYPYDTFYKGFSPRIAMAWNPHFSDGLGKTILGDGNTVIRGGYSRIYGRLNGVDLVLVPLLGTGLMQAVSCQGATTQGACLGASGATPATAFRIGTDGLTAPLGGTPSPTLPQPYFPGTLIGSTNGKLNLAAADGSALDPGFRPNSNDTFTLSVQREINSKVFAEVGYIGKLIHNEFQEIDIDAVPYMTTLGGQTFADAFGKTYVALCTLNVQTCTPNTAASLTAQPFWENALGGSNSAFCKAAGSCTAALLANSTFRTLVASNRVWELWNSLTTTTPFASSWTLKDPTSGGTAIGMNPVGGCPTTLVSSTVCKQMSSVQFNVSNGYGNYHAIYNRVTLRDWKGLTALSTFTWGRALGTGSEVQARSTRSVLDPFNQRNNYGSQGFDVKFVYTLAVSYKVPFYKSQQGVLGHILGGWQIAPLFSAQSGAPLQVTESENGTLTQAFGQSNPASTSSIYNAVAINPGNKPSNSLNYLFNAPTGAGTTATSSNTGGVGTEWLNYFSDPGSAYQQFRRLVLGVDTRGGAFGILRGFPRWNLDASVIKQIKATERVGFQFTTQFTNVFNHMQPSDPAMNINTPATFGRVSSVAFDSRQIEFGLRLNW